MHEQRPLNLHKSQLLLPVRKGLSLWSMHRWSQASWRIAWVDQESSLKPIQAVADAETLDDDWYKKTSWLTWQQVKIEAKEVLKVRENKHREVQPD